MFQAAFVVLVVLPSQVDVGSGDVLVAFHEGDVNAVLTKGAE